MPDSQRSQAEILEGAIDALGMANLGLDMMKRNSLMAKAAGLRNVAVFGRSVTHVLQKLRGVLGDEFDTWYRVYEEEMGKTSC